MLFEKINENVHNISDLLVEASILINYYYTKQLYNGNINIFEKKPRILDFVYQLKSKSKAGKYELDAEYKQLREICGLFQKYDGSYCSNLFVSAAQNYETVLMNNVVVHMYNRIKKFFKFVRPDICSFETLDALFNSKSKEEPNSELINALKKYLDFESNFHKLKKEWYTFIPLLYKLQRLNESNNKKNFRIFPQYKHGCKHLRYDTYALYQLLCSTDKTVYRKYTELAEHKEEIWETLFNYKKFETKNHKFNYSFTSDWVSVSLRQSFTQN